jgi:ribose-phosphate pyrophosphokinase
MKFLNIDPTFTPFGPGIRNERFTFPGGEPHIKLGEGIVLDEVTITVRVRDFSDVGALLVATDALRRAGATAIHLFIPYFPGARQDRVMVPGEPLTAKVYADLINAQNYSTVTVLDPHSEVVPALLNEVRVVGNEGFVSRCLGSMKDFYLIAPDGGALKKIYKLSQAMGGIPVVECGKQRDLTTGKLSGFKVYQDDLAAKACLIVDDICDGGATFLGLAAALKSHNAGTLFLAVTHGIFSKGTKELKNTFQEVFTTDSFAIHEGLGVTVIPCKNFMEAL